MHGHVNVQPVLSNQFFIFNILLHLYNNILYQYNIIFVYQPQHTMFCDRFIHFFFSSTFKITLKRYHYSPIMLIRNVFLVVKTYVCISLFFKIVNNYMLIVYDFHSNTKCNNKRTTLFSSYPLKRNESLALQCKPKFSVFNGNWNTQFLHAE